MKHAFSLVELSIVLVILGLLTGGVLTGQSLIRAAELRSVTTDFNSYQTAIMTFRDKYFGLPGDIRNATDFWGSAGGNGFAHGTCTSQSGTGTQTCNGNGNGWISGPDTGAVYAEHFLFWQHLANAGLIEGTFTGKRGAPTFAVLGVNSPVSKIRGASWEVAGQAAPISGSTAVYDGDYGNFLAFGVIRANGGVWDPVLTPEEAWNIDNKLDDGQPAKGKIVAKYWNNLCSKANDGSSTSDDLNASYNLQDSNIRCLMYFRNAF